MVPAGARVRAPVLLLVKLPKLIAGMFCNPVDAKSTVLFTFILPKLGRVVFCMVKVLYADKLIVPVREKEAGMVKFTGLVPSPSEIYDCAPYTAQAAPMVGVALFLITKIWPAVVKLPGGVPVPSVFCPQVASVLRSPVDLL